jgi:hypothetical protein
LAPPIVLLVKDRADPPAQCHGKVSTSQLMKQRDIVDAGIEYSSNANTAVLIKRCELVYLHAPSFWQVL